MRTAVSPYAYGNAVNSYGGEVVCERQGGRFVWESGSTWTPRLSSRTGGSPSPDGMKMYSDGRSRYWDRDWLDSDV
jgi:hypothetical protein